MLTRLLRSHLLRPYRRLLVVIVLLQAVQAPGIAVPADAQRRHRRQGHPRGRQRLHPLDRRGDARGDAGPGRVLGRRRLLQRPGGDELRPRRPRRPVPPRHRLLGPRGQPVRRAVAHHPHHQRRAAGADARRDGAARWRSPRRSPSSGGIVLALQQDVGPVVAACSSACPRSGSASGSIVRKMIPLFRLMQERIDGANSVLREQITGIRVVRAFVREPREVERFGEVNDDAHRGVAARRPPHGADVPDAPVHHQRVERGGAVVRRPPHRRRRHDGRAR